jgi:hypothetical protein
MVGVGWILATTSLGTGELAVVFAVFLGFFTVVFFVSGFLGVTLVTVRLRTDF